MIVSSKGFGFKRYTPPSLKKSNGEILSCPACGHVRKTRVKRGFSCRACYTHFDAEGVVIPEKTHCGNGHAIAEYRRVGPDGRAYCAACCRNAVAKRREERTECKHGHPMTVDNTYVAPGTDRKRCRTCRAQKRSPAYRSSFPQLTRTPNGEILRCPDCNSTKKYKRMYDYKCKNCGSEYDDEGIKMIPFIVKTRVKTKSGSGVIAGRVLIGRGYVGWR